jgi:hypothetical protein
LGQIRGQRAQGRGERKQRESDQIHPLPTGNRGKPPEYRQDRSKGELVGDSDPAHFAQPSQKLVLERRQYKLDNAGIELSIERGDARRSDDDPGIVWLARDEFGRRRLVAMTKGGTQTNFPGWGGR